MFVNKISYRWKGTAEEALWEGGVEFEIWLMKGNQKVWPPQPSGPWGQGYGLATNISIVSQALDGLLIASPGVEADTLEGFVSWTKLARGQLIINSQTFALPACDKTPELAAADPTAKFSFALPAGKFLSKLFLIGGLLALVGVVIAKRKRG